MARGPKILVVDDEPAIRRFLRPALRKRGYRVMEMDSVMHAPKGIEADEPDLVILGVPDGTGMEVVREVRKNSATPMIVLSTRSDEHTKVEALESGADDYIVRPFSIRELLARVEASLRHRYHVRGKPSVFCSGELSVDLARRLVCVRGERIRLSEKEYEVLQLLVKHAGHVLRHAEMLAAVWPAKRLRRIEYLRLYVRSLRAKIEPDPKRPQHIITEQGVGYRLQVKKIT